MSLLVPHCATVATPREGQAIVLTSYGESKKCGNLRVTRNSYNHVARLFAPLLSRWGEVIPAARDAGAVEAAVQDARRRGLDPIHLSYVACPDMVFSESAPNVVMPFWEYPDVPGEALEGNPLNDWVSTANRCDLVLVGGEFTAGALHRGGVRTPIQVVPVPTPDEYFRLPRWEMDHRTHIACAAYVFPDPGTPVSELWDAPDSASTRATRFARWAWRAWEGRYERFAPPLLAQGIRWTAGRIAGDRWRSYLRRCRREDVELSGVVYTSVIDPHEIRENWQDLLTGFVSALGDRSDATLVVQFVTREDSAIGQVLDFYRGVGLCHRCKIVFVTDEPCPEDAVALTRASTYYLATTRAEPCGLSLMNHLAAGRPGIAACHSTIGDYFGEETGLTIPCHPEPAPWPQDSRARIKTSWARLDWAALVERLRESYSLALRDPRAYDARAERARQCLRERASVESVWQRLAAALTSLDVARSRNLCVA